MSFYSPNTAMVFHSPNFLLFFLLLLIPYFLFKKARLWTLAAANVIFYGFSGIGSLFLFLFVTAVVYISARIMMRPGLRWTFWIGIGVALANLIFYKYTFFILDSIQAVTGLPIHIQDSLASAIVLPVGISFYTFQLLAYLIDMRRGELEPPKNLLYFWVFISLFPQLVAGPILRGDELMPQLLQLTEKHIRWQEIKYGLYWCFVGVLKKVVLADTIAALANSLFAKAESLSPVDTWIAAYAFGFQIYYDFSAYSDMALGLGYILGIKLIINFDTPYLSSNPNEFWKRWHISLSRWIKDYIYIGLGGNRKGWTRTQFNLLAAMMISGLWHGAMWTFVLWGCLHGLLLIVHKWTLALNRWPWIKQIRQSAVYRVAAIFVFFHIITWTWVFFRAQDMHKAFVMTDKMLHVRISDMLVNPNLLWIGGLFLLHVFESAIRHHESASSRWWHRFPAPLRGLVYLSLAVVTIYFMKGETYAFIYFQF